MRTERSQSQRAFTNTTLGEAWEEKSETADPEPLMARRENYAMCALYSRTVPWEILYRSAPTEPPPPTPGAGAPAPGDPTQSAQASRGPVNRRTVRIKIRGR